LTAIAAAVVLSLLAVGYTSLDGADPHPEPDRGRQTALSRSERCGNLAPGAALTQPLGINDRGDIVGAYIEAVTGPDPYGYHETGRLRGFVMREGRFTPIDFPGGEGTRVSGINNRGQMVGYYDSDDARRGFLLSNGRFTRIDQPGSSFTVPSRIDNLGRIVGGYLDPNGVNSRGFLWRNGNYTTIVAPGERTDTVAHDINDRGDIVIPADGTVIRQPETACGRPTAPASPPTTSVDSWDS
jgi:uncharacterized membrane protein